VIAIGQAGEKLSRFANWVNENDRASGRGGTGCVGGSKNLKGDRHQRKKRYCPHCRPREVEEAQKRALSTIMAERHHQPRKVGYRFMEPMC